MFIQKVQVLFGFKLIFWGILELVIKETSYHLEPFGV